MEQFERTFKSSNDSIAAQTFNCFKEEGKEEMDGIAPKNNVWRCSSRNNISQDLWGRGRRGREGELFMDAQKRFVLYSTQRSQKLLATRQTSFVHRGEEKSAPVFFLDTGNVDFAQSAFVYFISPKCSQRR
jgi:hypothetical protein